jgi:hypothetical protein
MQPEEFRDEIRNMIRDEIQSFCRKNPDQFTRSLDNPDAIKNPGDYNVFSLLKYHGYSFLIQCFHALFGWMTNGYLY